MVSSAMEPQTEEIRLQLELRQELLFFNSFGYLLVKAHNTLVDDNTMDVGWMKHVRRILE